MKKVNILITAGVLLIFIGMAAQLDKLIRDNEQRQETIENQAKELIKCKSENEHLWNNYYMNVSEYNGEYYE